MKNVIAFTDTSVADIMTPWKNVVVLPASASREKVLSIHSDALYSRYPVVSSSGYVIGILQIRKYLRACAGSTARIALSSLTDRPLFVDVDSPIDETQNRLSAAKTPFAIVRGHDGAYVGAVTVEDILEELVGEIYDESDEGGAAV